MEENDKPFACTVDGCTMRFTNEDHLTVHKKKHDMVLNLGVGQKSNIFVADQTPTPTRFIRNCEEVGLFQDLQNVNPFEETFRKAVEAAKSGNSHLGVESLHIPTGADDTLHTPHVFPHIIEDNSNITTLISSTSVITEHAKRKSPTRQELDRLLRPTSTTSASSEHEEIGLPIRPSGGNTVKVIRQEADTSQQRAPEHIYKDIAKTPTISEAASPVQLLLRMPDGKLVQVSGFAMDNVEPVHTLQVNAQSANPPSAVVVDTQPLVPAVTTQQNSHVSPPSTTTANSKISIAKQKLKQQLIKANRGLHSSKEPVAKPASNMILTCEGNRRTISSDGSETNSPPSRLRRSSSADDTDEKRQKFLERNRAAAMRCRKKRKTWVQELEHKAEDLQRTNQHLQSEVAALRAEVAQLKTLLLAHKDCPVTHAMAQGVHSVPAQQSQQIINVTLPLMTTHTTPTASVVQQQQPVVLKPLHKRQPVVLNKPYTTKRNLNNNSVSTSKRQRIESIENRPSSSPSPVTLLTSSNSTDNIHLVSNGVKHEEKIDQNLIHTLSVANTTTAVVSGTNMLIPSVVVTPSQISHVPPGQQLVSISLLEQNNGNYQTILVPKLCMSPIMSTHEHQELTTDSSDGATGMTQVIKLNPNVIRIDRPDAELIENKSHSNGALENGNDSDVEFLDEIPINARS